MLALRRSFTGPRKAKADRIIFQHITHHHLVQQAKRLCIYVSTNDEPDTRDLIRELLLTKEKTVIVPKIIGGSIQLYTIRSMEDLEHGILGILEPKNTCRKASLDDIDLFLVPGVAFGRDGTRIGMGKGYYDRLLKTVSAPTLGIAYAFQIFDSVPAMPEDIRVTALISDI